MKYLLSLIFGFLLILVSLQPISAQNLQYQTVNFKIEELRIFNDTMMLMNVRFQSESSQGQTALISGRGAMSMCSCYCDSIWDAWPVSKPEPDSLFGKGTLTFAATTSGSDPFQPGTLNQGGAIRLRGTLGIQEVTGGITRNDEFVLPIVFKLD